MKQFIVIFAVFVAVAYSLPVDEINPETKDVERLVDPVPAENVDDKIKVKLIEVNVPAAENIPEKPSTDDLHTDATFYYGNGLGYGYGLHNGFAYGNYGRFYNGYGNTYQAYPYAFNGYYPTSAYYNNGYYPGFARRIGYGNYYL